MKKWIFTYIKSLRKDIVYLLIGDVLFLLVMELVLKRIPAPYPLFVILGDITITLGLSFLASFIFYFVQVHLPEIKQRNDLYPCIAMIYNRILNSEKELLKNYVGAKSFVSLSESVIIDGAIKRNVNKFDAPLFLAGPERSANWMEYGFHIVDEIDKNWNMIMNYSLYLDSECMVILSKIQDDSTLGFFKTMRKIYPSFKKGLNINGIGKDLVRFWFFIQEQENYYNRVFTPYKT